MFGRQRVYNLASAKSTTFTSSKAAMLVTYRMPICASAPASGLRSEHSNPLHSALAGPDYN